MGSTGALHPLGSNLSEKSPGYTTQAERGLEINLSDGKKALEFASNGSIACELYTLQPPRQPALRGPAPVPDAAPGAVDTVS